MSALAQMQEAMLSNILDEDLPLPGHWNKRHAAGLAIYRNNYRSALIDALRSTFERTERLVGEESFARAAAHHLIAKPPSSWTLDMAGAGFDETCVQLFAGDPEVAELAWLEWAMHCAFVARDVAPLEMADFATATAAFSEQDWAGLRLEIVPGTGLRTVHHDLKPLWTSLAANDVQPDIQRLPCAMCAVVWREGERPVFILIQEEEGDALSAMMQDATYGEACEMLVDRMGEEQAITLAGAMLGRWLSEGLVTRAA
ncbi:DNA-binding domain-containing protein [Qipengyuania psychrotolerans]|uniref:DNA-binding domain-containing protein n=1 Tax=Qipengyuania psychrotolerans TaxID=2867238 RepID=A0ABX8ZI58_9SPHN|nr:DNA-binding domain-containing protein [Qipengyuania psychrotolerans]QZD87329.1 DNA-binding domain-containing protein [Qipengyuania psychrotolerans]